MKHTEPVESLEETLLSKVGMCYSVALALTHDPQEAQELTNSVMTWAWHFVDLSEDQPRIKMKLLTALRESFIQQRKQPFFSSREPSARIWST